MSTTEMTPEAMRREVGQISAELPGLTKAQEDAARSRWGAQERVDALDIGQWYGRPSGALKAALDNLKSAEVEAARTSTALAANHRRRAELLRALRQLVAA